MKAYEGLFAVALRSGLINFKRTCFDGSLILYDVGFLSLDLIPGAQDQSKLWPFDHSDLVSQSKSALLLVSILRSLDGGCIP